MPSKRISKLSTKNYGHLEQNDPREYWKLLNLKKKNNVKSNISLDTLKSHFEQLNNMNKYSRDVNQVTEEYSEHDYDYNDPVTEEEVISHIKRLKNNKASSVDMIVNEFLKNSSKSLVKLLSRMFKIVWILALYLQIGLLV